ncbi:MAG: hypothetical protein HY400_01320 [Elusimicrobia bacterium]|nr:hypothetical protein [Elusimicrobiota bacterium]
MSSSEETAGTVLGQDLSEWFQWFWRRDAELKLLRQYSDQVHAQSSYVDIA